MDADNDLTTSPTPLWSCFATYQEADCGVHVQQSSSRGGRHVPLHQPDLARERRYEGGGGLAQHHGLSLLDLEPQLHLGLLVLTGHVGTTELQAARDLKSRLLEHLKLLHL